MTPPATQGGRPRAFTWVVPHRVIGMGRPSAADLAALQACRVRHLISLTTQPLDDDDLSPCGITAVHLPLPDMSAPTMEQIERFVDTLGKLVDAGERVAVHCGAGYGRTGTMLACWLVSRGKRAEDALREVRKRRPGSVESRAQEDAVREYEARLRPSQGRRTPSPTPPDQYA